MNAERLIAASLVWFVCIGALATEKPLEQKLKSLMVPKVEFREASLNDVLTFLRDRSQELDREKVGINIITGGGLKPETVAKITMNLHSVSLYEVLRYVSMVADVKFIVEPSAVLIVPPNYSQTTMVTRGYRVAPTTLQQAIKATGEQAPAVTPGPVPSP